MDINQARLMIDDARINSKAVVFKNFMNSNPKWEQFIAHLNSEYASPHQETPSVPEEETFVGGVAFRKNLYFQVRGPLGPNNKHLFPEADQLILFFDEVMQSDSFSPSAFLNFVPNNKPIGVHADFRDTVYWQCIGKSEWQIHSRDNSGEYESYPMEPGDVIFVPQYALHTVITNEPRAAIAIGYNHKIPEYELNNEHDLFGKSY
jgi:hypothetical protein